MHGVPSEKECTLKGKNFFCRVGGGGGGVGGRGWQRKCWSTLKGKNLLPRGILFSEGRQNNFGGVVSPESVSVPLNKCCKWRSIM